MSVVFAEQQQQGKGIQNYTDRHSTAVAKTIENVSGDHNVKEVMYNNSKSFKSGPKLD